MVKASLRVASLSGNNVSQILKGTLKWASISLEEVLQLDRLDAKAFGLAARQAREMLKKNQWPIKTLTGVNGLANAFHRPRFKRVYVRYSHSPIYQPAQINEIYPKPVSYISEKTSVQLDGLRVHRNQLLMTRSGTVAHCALVSRTLDTKIFSDDVIRIEAKKAS